MAKMTLSGLQSFVSSYVDAAKQAGSWSATTNNFVGMLDKVGKQITIDGDFQDKLPELDGDELPLGKTIEEYFIDLTLPTAYDSSAEEEALARYLPSVESVAYSYTLGRKVIPTTIPFNDVERACINPEVAGSVAAKVMERLRNSQSIYKYACKKQLLGNVITKAEAITNTPCSTVLAAPVDTSTGEAFIKSVKAQVENASFANEGNSLGQGLIGAAPEGSLVLYIKKGAMPSIEVDVEAGAFHMDKVAMPCKVKVVDDFGGANAKFYAMLVDERGIKLHKGYEAVRDNQNGLADHISYFLHSEFTGFISKNTFVHIWKSSN